MCCSNVDYVTDGIKKAKFKLERERANVSVLMC